MSILAGCRSGSFLGQRYTDFTAYYNTFYNAKNEFDAGERALVNADQTIDRTTYLELFPAPRQQGRSQNFEEVIRKCADVLHDHPTSRWVDDALLLIGKSYYYQRNYVGAEQKFQETIDVGSRLEDEARFWLGRTLMSNRAYDAALIVIQQSLERESVSPRWVPMLNLAAGELYVRLRRWEEAVEFLERGIEEVHDRDLAARAQFLLGQVYETREQFPEAAASYAEVLRYRPVYELEYAALYNEARVTGFYLNANAGLEAARRMSRDDKYYENRFELEMLRARILKESGHPRTALATFDNLLVEQGSAQGTLRGRIHYYMAELFRTSYRDYPLAAAHYDTASTALRSLTVVRDGRPAPDAITDAESKAQVFKHFASVERRVAEYDSLLYLGSLDDAAFDSVITALQHQKAEELREAERERRQREAEAGFQRQGSVVGADQDTQFGTDATETQDSDHGFLFHQNIARVQDGMFEFRARWGDRPLGPNWRRQAAVRERLRIALLDDSRDGEGLTDAVPSTGSMPGSAALPPVDISGIPRDAESYATMKSQRAAAYYELANVLFLAMNEPDSAASLYRRVIEEDGNENVSQRAHYALAEVHRSRGDTEAARRLYTQIVEDYPESEFARRARQELNIAPLEGYERPDSTRLGENIYTANYRKWQEKEYREALLGMLKLASDFENKGIAPRAMLAAGMIYTEWARQDDLNLYGDIRADVFAPSSSSSDSLYQFNSIIPDTLKLETLYASVEYHFADTPYAERARSIRLILEEQRPSAPDEAGEIVYEAEFPDSIEDFDMSAGQVTEYENTGAEERPNAPGSEVESSEDSGETGNREETDASGDERETREDDEGTRDPRTESSEEEPNTGDETQSPAGDAAGPLQQPIIQTPEVSTPGETPARETPETETDPPDSSEIPNPAYPNPPSDGRDD